MIILILVLFNIIIWLVFIVLFILLFFMLFFILFDVDMVYVVLCFLMVQHKKYKHLYTTYYKYMYRNTFKKELTKNDISHIQNHNRIPNIQNEPYEIPQHHKKKQQKQSIQKECSQNHILKKKK